MIRLCKGCEPQALAENRDAWTAEYVNWLEDREGNEPRRYADPDIRAALEAETHSKCAYCEGRFKHVAYGHVEHKLPKRKYPELVCAWENLTVACPVCNTNKGDFDDPKCRLLDPHMDDVETMVVFVGSLAHAEPGSRADKTISRISLNRPDLLLAREEVLKSLGRILDRLERFANMRDLVDQLWCDVERLTAAEGQFASACRQILEQQLEKRGLARP
ncbi:MAG: hypothetical protein F4Y80_09550 [Caldilineaceae bacterium SB0665_bin_21]|nr:hypothetical protein [Caldilineaceae bacterium SB0665_bin_21]